MSREKELENALNELIHACEDMIDNYDAISNACEKGKELLPNYSEEPIFTEY